MYIAEKHFGKYIQTNAEETVETITKPQWGRVTDATDLCSPQSPPTFEALLGPVTHTPISVQG